MHVSVTLIEKFRYFNPPPAKEVFFAITPETKKSLLCILVILLSLTCCSKNSTPKPFPGPSDSVLPASLVTSYSVLINVSNSMTKDTIHYDDKNNIKSITHQFINNIGLDQTLDSDT